MERTLYEWFADTVARNPGAVALEADGAQLTYRDLKAFADQVAGRLIAAHGGVPRRVGLLAERRVASYAGYLAAQRLNATVIPLNPAFPAARNTAIATAGELDLVLASEAAADDDALSALPVPVLRTGQAEAGGPPPILPDHRNEPDAIAYVLFTSGSTGVPKGVPIKHRNVSAYLDHVIPRYGLGPGCRMSQTFDLTFDPSVFDMFAGWGSGATVVVPSREELLAPVRFVTSRRLTHWCSVPSVVSFARRLRSLAPDSMPTLRWSLFCGEPLPLQDALAWRRAADGSDLENIYGPTELTVTCTEYRLPRNPARWPNPTNSTVPIGMPYPGLEHLVLDADGHPAHEGELCIRGPQRFPGYLDPADNAGRFVAFDGDAAQIYDGTVPVGDDLWYRTGDRVVRQNGHLVHLGRLDQQVKVRGYRVELGEIEAVLRSSPGVRDALVVALPGTDGEPELHAVCTGDGLSNQSLQAETRRLLPAYMVPRTVSIYERLPLNPNGKIDRRSVAENIGRTVLHAS
ncbi:amino acid adenylation domain-containing protein [Streptomyces sp. TRM 70361]|uniref:amino acid adenylation domain-containing protein n=1 Tax=Streptomyces sp. TRM 70361 TaxID=3116553 RepID=UPI002E7AC8F5|nr:amino acid adenylation domain-containing protein [Streptomyces sp. TRM 70361]MEE1943040.1 amino acid adenylation domain-containing protein [Streptomyces sp. TRM 70361]